ncbi:hypothetical protein N665_1347s0020, partial [Sinapis alba]
MGLGEFYYGDLTEKWSDFSPLVDNTVLLYEQEHKQTSGKNTVSRKEEDEQRMRRIFRHFPRRPRRSSLKKPFQNLNGSSTSSSPLVNCNMVESEKTKTGFKKAKVSPLFTWEGKDTPDWMVQLMRNIKEAQEPKPFLNPFHKLVRNDFLIPVESKIIEEDINDKEKMGLVAVLVDQGTKKRGVFLKRWEMN